MNQKMKTSNPEVKNLQYAMRLAGIATSDSTAHHVLNLSKAIQEKGEEFNLRDSARIEAEIEALYPNEEEKKGSSKENATKEEKEEEVGEAV